MNKRKALYNLFVILLLIALLLSMAACNKTNSEQVVSTATENNSTNTENSIGINAPDGVYWYTSHETGDWSDWGIGQNGAAVFKNGKGEICEVTDEVARTGKYSLKMQNPGMDKELRGNRIFRWAEMLEEGYFSAWFMFPELPEVNGWLSIFQFKKNDSQDVSDPTFYIVLNNKLNGLVPCLTDEISEKYDITPNVNPAPVINANEWFNVEAYYKSGLEDGQITIWINGVEVWNFQNINTQKSTSYDKEVQWAINLYGEKVLPEDIVMYMDDCKTSSKRVSDNFFGTPNPTPTPMGTPTPAPTPTPVPDDTVDESFDELETGSLPEKWSIKGNIDNCSVYQFENGNKALQMINDNIKEENITPTKFVLPKSGAVVFEADLMHTGITLMKWAGVGLGNTNGNVMEVYTDEIKQLVFRDKNTNDIPFAKQLQLDTWYRMKYVINTETDTADVYLNDERVLEGVTIKVPTDSIDYLYLRTGSETLGTVYFDNIKLYAEGE